MRILVLIWMVVAWSCAASADVASYRVNAGDKLEVLVWQEEGLQRQVIVAPDGSISFPLAGQVRAHGRTVGQIERRLTEELSKYITDPVVTVAYIGKAERKEHVPYEAYLYVNGQVRQPGLHKFDRPTTALQGITQAGGLTEFAAKGRIRIIRKIKGRDVAIRIDYSGISTGRDTTTNIRIKSGDVIVVPERSIFGGLFE